MRTRDAPIARRPVGALGDRVDRLELDGVRLVDPAAGREGDASIVIERGRIATIRWESPERSTGLLVLPGLIDLHTHVRERVGGDAETVASGLAAAAHGGFTSVTLMANTRPPIDRPERAIALLAAVRESGSSVRVGVYGSITEDRAGRSLSPLGALANAGIAGFSDDGDPVADPHLLRAALTEAGALGLTVVEHAEETALTDGAEANEGVPATILGLRGWPAAAESAAVGRALAVLRQVVHEAPSGCRPRLHLTHVSTAAAVGLIRDAKRDGLPVSCDVTPHHLCLHDGWLGGDRRFAWEAAASPWAGGPVAGRPYDPATRVNPPLRTPDDALALSRAVADGTLDAIATDHAPHRAVDKEVEFGAAPPGISGIETALGLVLAAVDAGAIPSMAAVRALTGGPGAVLGRPGGPRATLAEGEEADLVVVERTPWIVDREALLSRGKNSPLVGLTLPGRVLMTIAGGRLAYVDPAVSA